MCSAWTGKLAGSVSQELQILRPYLVLGAQGLKRQNGLLPFRNLCDGERCIITSSAKEQITVHILLSFEKKSGFDRNQEPRPCREWLEKVPWRGGGAILVDSVEGRDRTQWARVWEESSSLI